jgi:hypothetical protein
MIATLALAMGYYSDVTLAAWSSDGAAALVTRDTSSSGTAGNTHTYVVVTTSGETEFTFDDTQDPDKAGQKVSVASCRKQAGELGKALAAGGFKGVRIDADRCAGKRDVVTITADAQRAVEASWVALPVSRQPTQREQLALDVAKGIGREGLDVATTTGKLVLVFWGENGDSTGPAHASAFAGTTQVVEDLR